MKTKRVRSRLALAFGVLIVILITVGYWGVNRLAEMNGNVQAIVVQRWQRVQLSREALRYSALNSRITMQIFLLQDKKEIDPLLEQRAQNTEKISVLLKTIDAGLESETEKQLVANVWTNRMPYVNSYKLALNLLLKEGKPEAGRKMMSGVVLTNLIAYHKAWEAFVEHQGYQMDKAGKAAEMHYSESRRQLITLVVVATSLAAAIALFVIRNMTREITSRVRAEQSLREAHDVLESRVQQRTVELTRAHMELQLREERFRKLSQSAPIGIFETDAAGRGLFYNPHWHDITGLSPADAFGDGWQKAVHPEDAERVFSIWQACVQEGREFDGEFRFRRPSGEDRWVHALSVVLRSESGEITGHVGTMGDITERKRAEAELAKTQNELVDASRQAGMAEVAIGVLHNVGNVLNSVNVASTCIAEGIQKSKATNLIKVVALLREHEADLGNFFTLDPKGKQLPGYLAQLAEHIGREQASTRKELVELQKHIDHIKQIVTMQQSFAKVSGVSEILEMTALVEDALRVNENSLANHDVQIIKEFEATPPIAVEKHKVLQILVNLMQNANQSCKATGRDDKQITLRIMQNSDIVRISVGDNGVGIPEENLTQIFNHGFTTKKNGHGFGLHSGANAAKEMGGSLTVHSAGRGLGAVFNLELPIKPKSNAHD